MKPKVVLTLIKLLIHMTVWVGGVVLVSYLYPGSDKMSLNLAAMVGFVAGNLFHHLD